MKIKVKGLVFVGAAAAIMLSAGAANAAKSTAGRTTGTTGDAGVVTSQKYSDAKYEWVDNKVDDTVTGENLTIALASDDQYPSMKTMAAYTQPKFGGDLTAENSSPSNKLVTATSTAGEIKYTDIVETATSAAPKPANSNEYPAGSWLAPDFEGSDYKVPSEATVIAALNALEDAIGGSSAKQPYNETGKKMVADPNGTWSSISTAVIEHTGQGAGNYVDITAPDNDGAISIDIDASKVQKNNITADAGNNIAADNVNTAANADKLATAGVVQRKQTAANKYQVSKDKEWEDVSSAVGVTAINNGVGGYLDAGSRTDGGVSLDIKSTRLAETEADVTAGDHKLTTGAGVKAFAVPKQIGAAATYDGNNQMTAASSDANKVLTVGADGRVTKGDYAMHKSTTALTTANAADSTVPTTKTVTDFVTTAMGGYTLPTMNSNCNDADAHCTLVTSYDTTNGLTMAWVPMAQPQ